MLSVGAFRCADITKKEDLSSTCSSFSRNVEVLSGAGLMSGAVLYSSAAASPASPVAPYVSPFDAAAPPGRAVILTAETCDAAAQETAARLVEEFVRLATSERDHDRSVAAFFLGEITSVIEARRKVQTEVLASLAPTTVRLLANTRLFDVLAAAGAAAAPPPDAALLFACARFLRFGAVHHPHLLLGATGLADHTLGGVTPRGLGSHPGAVAAAAQCLAGLAAPAVAGALRAADVKRARAHLLSLVLHLANHPLCPVAELMEVVAPGSWLRARLLRMRCGDGSASTMAALLLARVGAHPSDSAACQGVAEEAEEDALLEEGGAAAARAPGKGRPPTGRRASVDLLALGAGRRPGAGERATRTRSSMDGRIPFAGSHADERLPVPMEGVEGPAAMELVDAPSMPAINCPRRKSAGW